tara:strand:+ start:5899 stop:6696 length:798 start_codon:yes stop_codon:yes gene_type:complete
MELIPKIIIYYQTFIGLQGLLQCKPIPVSHIHLCSFHFGRNPDNSPYIHLNNFPPEDPQFDSVWKEIKQAHEAGVKIVFMFGGAGGAFTELFSDFTTYYSLLQETIRKYPFVSGIDLDVEEYVSLGNIEFLIRQLHLDFPTLTVCMAPVSYALQQDNPGMGGFKYKEIEHTQQIDYYNGQFYGDYTADSYNQVIKNGWNPPKIVFGLLGNDTESLEDIETIVKSLYEQWGNAFGGVYLWEYSMAPRHHPAHPEDWALAMWKLFHS